MAKIPTIAKTMKDKNYYKGQMDNNLNKIENFELRELFLSIQERQGDLTDVFRDFRTELLPISQKIVSEITDYENTCDVASQIIKTYWAVYFALMLKAQG